MELHEMTASEAAGLIRAGELGPVEYARGLLERQVHVEPRIHALAHFDADNLVAGARRAEISVKTSRVAGGAPPPLIGIPVGIKDNIDTAGVPTRVGSALHADRVPEADAPCLSPLWKAGAYLHSKTVTTELAYFDPGPTRNPWNLGHTPGGSSSGSAAGVAAGLFPLALGSQTAGSVIRPAAYCGVVGFVPTQGSISLQGVYPFAPTVDALGMFSRSVEDAALAFAILTGSPGIISGTGGTQPLDRTPFLGLGRKYFTETADDEEGRLAIHTAKVLHGAGAVVHVVHLPDSFSKVHDSHRRIMEVEMARGEGQSFQARPDAYGRKLAELIRAGLDSTEEEYVRALEHRRCFRADAERLVGEVDALLLPSAPSAAPFGLETTGDPRFSVPWTNAGFPVITLPASLTGRGLPLGIQLVGAPGNDLHLLRVARCVEERLDWGRRMASLDSN